MALTREQKKEIIDNLEEKINRQKSMVFVDYKGLKVKDLFDLRKKLKKEDAALIIAKKTLMGLAFKAKKIEIKEEELKGQPAIIFGFQDEIKPAKVAEQFSRELKNLKILGGYFEDKFMGAEEMIALARLPSKQELLGQLIGSISAPVSNFVNVLQGNIKNLVYVLSSIKGR